MHQGYRKISRINVVICPSVCEASGFSAVNEWLDILFQFFFSHLASVYNGMQLWKKENIFMKRERNLNIIHPSFP